MSYQSEHRRMKPLLDAAHKWDIATNPDPKALFEAGSAGFQLWCTPDDNPGGVWTEVADKMIAGAFSKPCAYVGGCHWEWEGEEVVGLNLGTDAYFLRDCWHQNWIKYDGERFFDTLAVHNHPQEIEWCLSKIRWLWLEAYEKSAPIPGIIVNKTNQQMIYYKATIRQGENK